MDDIVDPGYFLEKGLARIALDHTGMSITEKIRDNFSREVWKGRFDYVKYTVLDFFYKSSLIP